MRRKDAITIQFDIGEELEEFIQKLRIRKDAIVILFDTGGKKFWAFPLKLGF